MRNQMLIIATFCLMLLACEPKSKLPVLKLVWETDTLFKTPESVLWDSKNEVIMEA